MALLHADLVLGMESGEFTHHQHAKTIEQCKHACCRMPGCDVAYMKNGKCYSVDCVDYKSCLWIDASDRDDRDDSSTVVYIKRSPANTNHVKGIFVIL